MIAYEPSLRRQSGGLPARETTLTVQPPAAPGWSGLLNLAGGLEFKPHNIRGLADPTGRVDLPLDPDFPLAVRLFHFKSNSFTRISTWHESLELLIPLDSGLDFQMGDRLVTLEPGDLVVVDNLSPHTVVDRPGIDTRVVVVSFSRDLIHNVGSLSHDFMYLLPFQESPDGGSRVLFRMDPASDGALRALCSVLEHFFQSGQSQFWRAGCQAWLLVLLQTLSQKLCPEESLNPDIQRRHQLAGRFKKLTRYIQHNFADPIAVEDAARLSGMSRSQFSRQFKAFSGLTFVTYLTNVRLKRAAHQLRNEDLSIADISAAVGFSDQSYFDRCFKKAFGVTPRDFKQSVPSH